MFQNAVSRLYRVELLEDLTQLQVTGHGKLIYRYSKYCTPLARCVIKEMK